MRITTNILRIALFLLVTYSLKTTWRLKEAQLPPLASFFSPFSGFWQNADPIDGPANLTFQLDGLSEGAEIVWDDRGVPHIFATNYRDAIFLQGYAHAADRLWQMDFSTRAAAGRLSEILGPIALEFDKEKRRRGLLDAAINTERSWRKFPGSYDLLNAYSEGVNAYLTTLESGDLPLEYKLLQYEPEPWSPLKTCLFFKSMSEVLCSRNKDLGTTNARAILGDSLFHELYPPIFDGEEPIIPDEVTWAEVPDSLLPMKEMPGIKEVLFGVKKDQEGPEGSGIGSNNWAVSPEKTANGSAILCNDPHLKLTLPSVWYETHIVCPETNVYGVGFPGAPGIIIGFNEHIAFGFTNSGIDVFDWYLMDWKDEQMTRYQIGDKIFDVDYRIDTILVKGKPPVLDSVKITKYGPVFSESMASPYRGMAFQWIANEDPGTDEIGTFLSLNLSKDLEDYKAGISGFTSPAQNMIYADKAGNIALTVQGRFPIKAYQQGRFILDGSMEGLEWEAYIPDEFKMRTINPERGYVSSANQRPTSEKYPFYYSSGDFRPYRGTIVNLKLDTMKDITPEKMKQLQLDNQSLQAMRLLPPMMSRIERSSLTKKETTCLSELSGWKFNYERSLQIPILFELWRNSFRMMALDELTSKMSKFDVRLPRDWKMAELISDSTNIIWDNLSTEERESAIEIIRSSYSKACAQYDSLLMSDQTIDWGKYKGTRIMHLARIEAFSSDTLYTSGAAEALNAIKKDEGPSWRMVVEIGDEVNAWGIYPGGQSGNPGNRNYARMIHDWQEGKYYPLKFVDSPDDLADCRTGQWIIKK